MLIILLLCLIAPFGALATGNIRGFWGGLILVGIMVAVWVVGVQFAHRHDDDP